MNKKKRYETIHIIILHIVYILHDTYYVNKTDKIIIIIYLFEWSRFIRNTRKNLEK